MSVPGKWPRGETRAAEQGRPLHLCTRRGCVAAGTRDPELLSAPPAHDSHVGTCASSPSGVGSWSLCSLRSHVSSETRRCLCTYTLTHIYPETPVHTHTHTHIHPETPVHEHTHIHPEMPVCMHTLMHTLILAHTHRYACVHTLSHTHNWRCLCTHRYTP